MNPQQRRMDAALQRRQEEAEMGRNRLYELLPRAQAAKPKIAVSLHLQAALMASEFSAADIRGAYTYYEGGRWHGKVTLAYPLKLGGGNRIGTPRASPCGTEAEAEEAVVMIVSGLLAVADSFANARPDQRRRLLTTAEAVVSKLTGDRAVGEPSTSNEVGTPLLDTGEENGPC